MMPTGGFSRELPSPDARAPVQDSGNFVLATRAPVYLKADLETLYTSSHRNQVISAVLEQNYTGTYVADRGGENS